MISEIFEVVWGVFEGLLEWLWRLDRKGRGALLRRPCACTRNHETDDLLGAFETIREGCPPLKQVLVPDSIWPEFLKSATAVADEVGHQSILVFAFDRGHLRRITSPLHRYLMEEGTPKAGLRKLYRNDLQEGWLFETDLLERHRKARAFMGKLSELIAAEWLETDGWRVTELEAFREGSDIVAVRAGQGRASFEVKYLGQEDQDFMAMVASLRNGPTWDTKDPYAAVNYLVFRVYEAAKQLQRANADGRRTVLFVVNAITWDSVGLQLQNNWIDWSNAKLYEGGTQWQAFLAAQRQRYPQIDDELPTVIRSLHDIWILKLRYGFELTREYAFRPAG